jgi:SSS family solute:Na+ symporter
MSPHLPFIALYSAGLIALGVYLGRHVKSTSGFFVANRGLSAGLIFSTVLAANIGAGSTVGAAGLGYKYGLSAWWWNGSAGIGSLILALWIGPRIWRQASKFGFLTVGDLLEHHFGPKVRGAIASILWFATLAILAGQIIGIGLILNVVAGLPKAAGCVVGGVLVTTYFTAGGLHGSAWVNMVQLTVKLAGFAIALPGIWIGAGGWNGLMQAAPTPDYGTLWHGATSASFLVLLVPAFMSSPGLLQKAYGGKDERAVRLGIGVNGLALLVFGFIPALLGMAARLHHPGLPQELALPTLLARDLPVGLGSLLLAAIFSAELSAGDAALFMLSTSLSQDLYRRFIRPDASDSDVLRAARFAALGGGAFAVLLATLLPTIVGALSIFYAMLGACVFVPVLVALHARVDRRREIGWSLGAGAGTVVVVRLMLGESASGLWTPASAGLLAAVGAYLSSAAWRRLATASAGR